MSSRAWWIGAGVLVVLSPMACSDDNPSTNAPVPPPSDAGTVIDAAPSEGDAADPKAQITIRTRAPASSISPGGPTNATWAAHLTDTGQWSVLAPSDLGAYSFATASARWAVAFACADDRTSLVAIYERPVSVTALDVVLDEQCGPGPSDAFVVSGSLTHVPLTTGWLDFGYALDARGAVLPTSGDSASYEIVNVVQGTWDIGFGLRDQGGSPLTKIAFVRGRPVSADSTVDVDLDAVGFVPGSKKLTVSGFAPADEALEAPVAYALGDARDGVDVGPQDIPTSGGVVELAYATIPAASQQPSDRYRPAILATRSNETGARGVKGAFHAAFDVAVELPPSIEAPTVALVATSPYVRIASKLATSANAASYEVLAVARISQKSQRVWRTSIDASLVPGPDLEVTLPDFAALQGFDTSWAMPPDLERKITATVYEKAVPLGDGTSERFSSRTATMPAP